MRIHVLCDDSSRNGFESEHGFSVLVDSVFFDTGKSNVFFKNARKLGIERRRMWSSVMVTTITQGAFVSFRKESVAQTGSEVFRRKIRRSRLG
ncbi:beta-lactamase domain-containing protein [Thermotoga sp. Mc24]|nr:beta-lactamase domain-containing protein [Thermotoga sp. Mc24]